MKRIHAIVSGRVQGVYYRASTQNKANLLGLSGWVRNLADGSVEFEAEGPAPSIDALIEWANQGPPMANVTNVELKHMPLTNERHVFEVR